MANLKEIRDRISSVKSTIQITGAMKMISAAKLKKAQRSVSSLDPYTQKISQLLYRLQGNTTNKDELLNWCTNRAKVSSVLIVAITSNRGLCGIFNTNVVRQTLGLAKQYADKNFQVFSIGKKGHNVLSKSVTIHSSNDNILDELSYNSAAKIAQSLINQFMAGTLDEVKLVYNRSKNTMQQVTQVEQLLPLALPEPKEKHSQTDYIYEPNRERILAQLLPAMVKLHLISAIRNSFAAEHAARMVAMQKATDSAVELFNSLKLEYNKARQAAITGEILEIVGGAEVIK